MGRRLSSFAPVYVVLSASLRQLWAAGSPGLGSGHWLASWLRRYCLSCAA